MVTELHKDNLDILQSKGLVIVDFYAEWCGPCMMFKPTFEKVAQNMKEQATFVQANVDNVREIAVDYRVSSIPTLIILKNGSLIDTHTGTLSESDFIDFIQKNI